MKPEKNFTNILDYLKEHKKSGWVSVRIGELDTWGEKISIDYLIECIETGQDIKLYDTADYSIPLNAVQAIICSSHKISIKNNACVNPYYDPETKGQNKIRKTRKNAAKYKREWGWTR